MCSHKSPRSELCCFLALVKLAFSLYDSCTIFITKHLAYSFHVFCWALLLDLPSLRNKVISFLVLYLLGSQQHSSLIFLPITLFFCTVQWHKDYFLTVCTIMDYTIEHGS